MECSYCYGETFKIYLEDRMIAGKFSEFLVAECSKCGAERILAEVGVVCEHS